MTILQMLATAKPCQKLGLGTKVKNTKLALAIN
jgi:hypothetical protein